MHFIIRSTACKTDYVKSANDDQAIPHFAVSLK